MPSWSRDCLQDALTTLFLKIKLHSAANYADVVSQLGDLTIAP